jgi:hypothetical protein
VTKSIQENHANSYSLVALAGFPKSGNTLINETLNYAGQIVDSAWVAPRYEYQNQDEINRLEKDFFAANPFLRKHSCHIKTHLSYSTKNYNWDGRRAFIDSIVVIIRNPFDTLLSATNYLRYSANLNKRLTANQITTLSHFYPEYSESDVLDPELFSLRKLREQGALDKALEIFSVSNTCIPQFLVRSGTWLDFYQSFNQTKQPVLQIRFEDIVKSPDNYQDISFKLSHFLDCDPVVLASAFARQNEACHQSREANDLFFPVAESNYFYQYFEARTLRRFCNKYQKQLRSTGYEDLVDRIMSS